MATGLIGTLSGAGSLSYTPVSNAKIVATIGGAGAASVSICGVNGLATASVTSEITTYVGGGQLYSVVSAANASVLVSSIEEFS